MTATDLERQLARLADSFDPPVVPVAADVARGRRRLLRTRMTVVGAAAATAAVLASATLLGGGTPRSGPQPVDRTPDPERTVEATDPVKALPDLDPRNDNAATLRRWNDLLAEHLDPQREHLQPYTRSNANSQSGSGGYLGSRFTWTNPGEEGMGMLVIGVARSRSGSWDSPCMTGQVSCRDARGPDGQEARIGTSDSVTTVELEQTDGDVVTLTLDLFFGNNSLVPISGTDITPEQLLEAAADERFDLPEPPPVSSIDGTIFQEVAAQVASQDGRWQVDDWVLPATGPTFEGWVHEGGRQVAIVNADALPTSAGYGLPQGCPERQFRACERREVDGQVVFVGRDDQKYYPGTQVIFAGPENVVRIQWQRSGDGGAEPDLEGLIGFVTDPRWQT